MSHGIIETKHIRSLPDIRIKFYIRSNPGGSTTGISRYPVSGLVVMSNIRHFDDRSIPIIILISGKQVNMYSKHFWSLSDIRKILYPFQPWRIHNRHFQISGFWPCSYAECPTFWWPVLIIVLISGRQVKMIHQRFLVFAGYPENLYPVHP